MMKDGNFECSFRLLLLVFVDLQMREGEAASHELWAQISV
jgi:hypothetical protein